MYGPIISRKAMEESKDWMFESMRRGGGGWREAPMQSSMTGWEGLVRAPGFLVREGSSTSE